MCYEWTSIRTYKLSRYRQTVIRNIPQLQKLDNVAVTPEEMADAMRRGIELDHPLDGGSDNQSSMLQGQRQGQRQETRQESEQMQRHEPREENKRISRSYEQEQEPQRRESIQVQMRNCQRLKTRKKI